MNGSRPVSLLGLDIGTTGCKAIVFNEDGETLGLGYKEYPMNVPRPGWMELDPEILFQGVVEAVRQAVKASDLDHQILSMSVATMGEVAFPVDSGGRAIYPGILHFDSRGIEEADWWDREVGQERIFQITGMPKHQMYTANKLLWLKKHRPETFQEAAHFLLVQAYVYHRLGLPPVVDYSSASRTMLFDVVQARWSEELFACCGFDLATFPEVVPSGTTIGTLSPESAHLLSLPTGIKVAAGGHDQPCAALGTGVVEPNMAVDSTGTVECITVIFDRPVLNQQMLSANMPCYRHVDTDYYVTPLFSLTGGSILRWFRDHFSRVEVEAARRDDRNAYDLILEGMSPVPSRLLVLPHFVGSGTPALDSRSKGAILGLSLETDRPELIRALLEGVTMEMNLNLHLLERAGIEVRELRAVGGAAQSESWLQLKANIFGLPILAMNVSEATCLGAAILAGRAAELYPSLKAGAQQIARVRQTFQPDLEQHATYKEKFKIYQRLYPTLKEISHAL